MHPGGSERHRCRTPSVIPSSADWLALSKHALFGSRPSPCLNYLLLLAASAIHGSNCTVEPYLCAPVPADRPHDVDCSWIQSRFTTFGGTGFADGVGASESEQYLSAMYFAIVRPEFCTTHR